MLALLYSVMFGAFAAPGATVISVPDPITVDGVLDEDAWQKATPIDTFARFQPTEGGAPQGITEVRFLQDEKALYVGIHVREAGYPIRARISPREAINADDQIGVYLDTFRDGRSGYIFYFNPLGIQQDIRHNNGDWNPAWNTAYRSIGTVVEDGYDIEIAFPWRSIKYASGDDDQEWGVIITRKIPSEGAKYGHPAIERNHPRVFSLAAPLTGVRPAGKGSGLELIPTLTAIQQWPRETAQQFSGFDPPLQVLRPSIDARYGITPDLSLTAAVNPDFSQVESDVSDVRLNPRFAFQFPETRPFFLDGSEFFVDRSRTLYSRSINEPIYGVKLTGREGGVGVGIVNAIDRSPLPTFNENGTPGFAAEDVTDRQAVNTVSRVRVDAFKNGSVGLTLADKRIYEAGDPAKTGAAGGHFDAVGADLSVPFAGRWTASVDTLQSFTGSATTDTKWGQSAAARIDRASGIGAGMAAWVVDRTQEFRNETGFQPQSGLTSYGAMVDYTFTPDGAVDTWKPSLEATDVIERNGETFRQVEHGQDLVVGGIHRLEAEGGVSWQHELGVDHQGWFTEAGYQAQLGPVIQLGPRGQVSSVLDYGQLLPALSTSASLDMTIRPTTALRLDTRSSYGTHTPQNSPAQTATLNRLRMNWQFTREVGLRVVEEHIDGTELDPALRSSVLLTWLKVPGTAGYLGFSETTDLSDGTQPIDRSIFAKISVLLRP